MLKIAITGSSGLIGSRVVELLHNDFQFIQLELPNFDITDKNKAYETIKKLDFDIFFHLAAYTNVDMAEKEKKLAYSINVEGTKNITEAVFEKKKGLIFVSTDFVFNGKEPHYEDSKPNPLGYYAQTKFQGEQLIKNKAMIVRLSYPYRSKPLVKPDFVKRLKTLLEENKQLNLMTDSLITPTFVDDIAYAMKYLFLHFSPQIYHLVGADSYSPFEAAKLIAKTFGLSEKLISPTTYKEYSLGKAPRPQYSVIRTRKNNFYKMKTFSEGLQEIKKQLTKYHI